VTANNNAQNVSAGKPKASGAVLVALKTTGLKLPKDAVEAPDAAFENGGYVSEDGLTNKPQRSSETTKAWGGDTVMAEQTEYNETFEFKFIETNPTSLKVYFGDANVTVSSDGKTFSVEHNAKPLDLWAFIFEMIKSGNMIQRTVVPNGKIAETGDIVYNGKDPVGYQITVQALPDENGRTAVDYHAVAVAG